MASACESTGGSLPFSPIPLQHCGSYPIHQASLTSLASSSSLDELDHSMLPALVECFDESGTPPPSSGGAGENQRSPSCNRSNLKGTTPNSSSLRMSPCPYPLTLSECRSLSVPSVIKTEHDTDGELGLSKPARLTQADSGRSLIVPLPPKIDTPSLLDHGFKSPSTFPNLDRSATGSEVLPRAVGRSSEMADKTGETNNDYKTLTETTISVPAPCRFGPPNSSQGGDSTATEAALPNNTKGGSTDDSPSTSLGLPDSISDPLLPTDFMRTTSLPQPLNTPLEYQISSSSQPSWEATALAASESFLSPAPQRFPSPTPRELQWTATATNLIQPTTTRTKLSDTDESLQPEQQVIGIAPFSHSAPPPQVWFRPSSTAIPLVVSGTYEPDSWMYRQSASATPVYQSQPQNVIANARPASQQLESAAKRTRMSMDSVTSAFSTASASSQNPLSQTPISIGSASTTGPAARPRTKLVGENRLKIQFLSLGHLGETPQHFGKKRNRIPDGLSGIHEVYNQRWRFEIHHHKKTPNELTTITWSITNLASGTTLTRTETPHEAFLREFKGQTICNQLMRDAIAVRARELEKALEENKDKPSKLANIKSCLRCLRPKKCIMGLLFFGLLHESVQDHLKAEERLSGRAPEMTHSWIPDTDQMPATPTSPTKL